MGKTKIAVYGLSTEGYSIASQMAIKGADVSLIDELTPSAISINSEIAKTYPDIVSLREDEPLLSMEPVDVAISKAQYLFFSPQIRKTGQDTKTDIHSKFKNAISSIKKNCSIVYNIPVGIGENNENVALLEHVTGFKVGKSINYFYFPLSRKSLPQVIGSFQEKVDPHLAELLSDDKKEKKFVGLFAAEHFHAVDVLSQFSNMCSVLEICKFAKDDITKKSLSLDEFTNIFLDDVTDRMYDLKSLNTSLENTGTLTYLINGNIKSIDNYIKRLIDEIRGTLKKYNLKASKTKITLSWTLDQYQMRGDKIEMANTIITKLRDYINDVATHDELDSDIFHSEKTMVIVSCSKNDYDDMIKRKDDNEIIIIKANPLCQVIQYE